MDLIKYYLILLIIGYSGLLGAQQTKHLSLDGTWEIIFDEHNEGRSAKWMNSIIFEKHPDRQEILIPSAWELIKKDYEGLAFYRKEFEIPADWAGKVIRLQFGAVNYLTEVWLNDEVVGFHEGGFTPFEFRVDEMAKVGEKNTLTLRVVGPIFLSDKEIDGMKALEMPQWRGGITGGIWQSVKLVATDAVYVDDVYIQPNIHDNTATFHTRVDHTAIEGTGAEIELEVIYTDSPEKEVVAIRENWQLHPGKNQKKWTLSIPDTKYWSPDSPHLYRANVRIRINGNLSDEWTTRFGMRELTIKDKDFYLNGKKIYIKAAFFEGLYPNGICAPDSKEMARREIQLAKAAGFNMIRPWRHPPVPMWLDLADELGVLVVGSPALECMQLPFATPYLPKRVENEVSQAILRDRNRACIVQWELFNELHRPVLKQLMRPMAMVARKLDPTRLILDESGGWAFGANMYLPNDFEPTKFNDIHNYPGPFINRARYDGYLSIGMTEEEKTAADYQGKTPGRNVVPGLMSYVSELGYGSLPDLTTNNQKFQKSGNPLTPAYRYHHRLAKEQKEILKEAGFEALYPDMQQFYLDQQSIHGSANKRMIEAVRANPDVDGYCIHALVAGDWILGAGLLDLWRNPKTYAYEGTKAANQAQIISIRSSPRNIYASEGAKLEIIGINELEAVKAEVQISLVRQGGFTVFQSNQTLNWGKGIQPLIRQTIDTKEWGGSYTYVVKVVGADQKVLTENSYPITVFQANQFKFPSTSIATLDPKGKLSNFLVKVGLEVSEFSQHTAVSTPVFVVGTENELVDFSEQYQFLNAFMKNGGTVVYIDGVRSPMTNDNAVYPFSAKVHPAQGLWTCIPHLVHDHPIFQGLPSKTMMRDLYENVWATHTLRNIQFEGSQDYATIVGSIGFDWFSKEHKMHYSGPGASWWGADVAEIPLGKGRCIVSQLRIVENLGKDPVADKILGNILNYIN